MENIHDAYIDHSAAWTNVEIGGKAGLVRQLSVDETFAIDKLLSGVRGVDITDICREQFSEPAIDAFMTETVEVLMKGRGSIILSGLDRRRYSLDDFQRIYWGLATHIGRGAIQSPRGERIGLVRKEDNPTARAYLGSDELKPHCDFHEIIGLACFEKSEEGGYSGLVSGLAIHNAIRAENPDLLPVLYEGFWHGLHVLEAKKETVGTEGKIPIFSTIGGLVSCFYHAMFMQYGAQQHQTEFPVSLVEALKSFDRLSIDPEIAAKFLLEPGEMLFWHNYINLHSRTAFKNSPARDRLLLRLWINPYQHRPAVPEITARAALSDRWYGT